MRDVCPRCRRPAAVCYCALLPSLPTATRVVFLQHPRERRVAIGTARMAHLALPNSELHEGVCFDDNARIAALAGDPTTAVLFPGGDPCARERGPALPVRSLVVVDGTWSQAKKVLKMNPRLAAIRRIGVIPRAPGNYRIRKEPRPECLATVEAVASALAALEEEPARFDQMLRAFEFMVDRQIERAAQNDAPRRYARPAAPGPLTALRCFLEAPARLVLVEGEANVPGATGAIAARPELLHLVASRASGERFEAFLRPRGPLGPCVAHQIDVPEARLLGGEDAGAALARFRAFVGEDVVLGTWGRFTLELLEREGLRPPGALDLRDLCARTLRRRPGGVRKAVEALGGGEPPLRGSGRAGRTLGCLEVVLARLLALAGQEG